MRKEGENRKPGKTRGVRRRRENERDEKRRDKGTRI